MWRVHKKNYQEFLRAAVLPNHYPLQKRCVERVLRRIVQTPEKVLEHVKLCVFLSLFQSAELRLTHFQIQHIGSHEPYVCYTPESVEDRAVMAAEESLALGANLYLPGTTLANVFPVLTYIPSWFPGAKFKRQAERVKALASECQQIPWEFVQKQHVSSYFVVPNMTD